MSYISSLGTIMGIWAHPDDETYAMGGLFALASEGGQKTICITATRGEQGVQDEARWPQAKLADIRTNEMASCMQILGVKHHHWLDYRDGECKNVDVAEAATRLLELIELYKPDSIFTFGPDGMTGHEDHKTMSVWVERAVSLLDRKPAVYHAVITTESYQEIKQADAEFNMFFNTDNPCICSKDECSLSLELEEDVLDTKIMALESMPSQTEYILSKHKKSIRLSGRIESFMISKIG